MSGHTKHITSFSTQSFDKIQQFSVFSLRQPQANMFRWKLFVSRPRRNNNDQREKITHFSRENWNSHANWFQMLTMEYIIFQGNHANCFPSPITWRQHCDWRRELTYIRCNNVTNDKHKLAEWRRKHSRVFRCCVGNYSHCQFARNWKLACDAAQSTCSVCLSGGCIFNIRRHHVVGVATRPTIKRTCHAERIVTSKQISHQLFSFQF